MTKPMTTIIVDGLTWYSEDDWKVLVAENARLEAENAKLKAMIADQINSTGDDPEIMAATRVEWAARAKAAEAKELEERLKATKDDAKEAEAYAEEIYAHAKELEAKLERASKMLPRALLAIYKDRKQEVIDVLETAIAELTGGKDD